MGVAPRIPGENAKGKMLAQIYEYGTGSASIKALYCNEKLATASDGAFEIHIKKRVHIGLLAGCRHEIPPIRLI